MQAVEPEAHSCHRRLVWQVEGTGRVGQMHDSRIDPGCGDVCNHRREPIPLKAREGFVLLRHGEVRPHASELESRRSGDLLGERNRPIRGCADAVHPGVHEEMDSGRSRNRTREGVDELRAIDAGDEIPSGDLSCVVEWRFGEQQYRRFDPGLSKARRLLHHGDREPRCSGIERGFCNGHVAVAVCVGLDDGDETGRCDLLQEHLDVVRHRRQVDLDP